MLFFKKTLLESWKLKTKSKQINNKRTLVNLYKDIVYQQHHKSHDSNACLSDGSPMMRGKIWPYKKIMH